MLAVANKTIFKFERELSTDIENKENSIKTSYC